MKGLEHDNPSVVFPEDHHLAVLGHELKNVLNGLLGMVELLGESGLQPDQVRWLRAIQQSGRQMESLIRYVWSFNTVNEPDIVPRREHVDGMELLEQVVISHTPQARSVNNQLVLVVDPEMARFWRLDACLVRQLLDNLVGNAVKFTRGGKIVVEARPEFGEGKDDGSIRLQVSDTGAGFNEASAAEIFGAYRRCDESGSGDYTNRGLGLYICQNIVHALRGRISCTSVESGGSRFRVLIPGALSRDEARGPILNSALLARLFCKLELGEPLRLSISSFLCRLGVPFCDRKTTPNARDLTLVIRELTNSGAARPPSLLFESGRSIRGGPSPRILEIPVLESTLESVLLEIALEWRSLAIRNESRDSTPRQR